MWVGLTGGDETSRSCFSLVPERFDRIHSRGFDRREQAEEDADPGGEADAEREGPPGQRDREARDPVDDQADAAAKDDPEDAAGGGQERGFDQELPQDLAAAGAEGFGTPISRVRSVTEMVMIAMTPMPPTISAIELMTTKARNVAWLN